MMKQEKITVNNHRSMGTVHAGGPLPWDTTEQDALILVNASVATPPQRPTAHSEGMVWLSLAGSTPAHVEDISHSPDSRHAPSGGWGPYGTQGMDPLGAIIRISDGFDGQLTEMILVGQRGIVEAAQVVLELVVKGVRSASLCINFVD